MGEACIHTGCKYGHTGVIQYLVTRTDNIDSQDHVRNFSFLRACYYPLALFGLSFRVYFSLSFQHLETGLHIAAWHGFPRIVEILCQAGASVNTKNEVG